YRRTSTGTMPCGALECWSALVSRADQGDVGAQRAVPSRVPGQTPGATVQFPRILVAYHKRTAASETGAVAPDPAQCAGPLRKKQTRPSPAPPPLRPPTPPRCHACGAMVTVNRDAATVGPRRARSPVR